MRIEESQHEKYESLKDQEIWNLISQSDMNALSYIYNQYYSDLYYFGLKCSKNEQLSKDCIQDLFIKLWEKREKISIQYTIKSYLITALRRTILDKFAAEKKIETKNQEVFLENDVSLSVQDLIIYQEADESMKKQMETALQSLTAKQKEIVYLRFYQEMSYDEIAESLDIKYQSVRNSIYESMKVLKRLLLVLTLLFA
ncbi:MAG: sigma-70 family RNA polymerase sigma factor [Reichenbachiella sp.]|uniref:RNA polymerase sigma factor n=1 Tax=Reichenbachiella sp. TaxID=2184521 RepID=UPI0032678946